MSECIAFEDDINPRVEAVVGVRSDSVRYNSESGFIYLYQKSTSINDIFVCKNRTFDNGGCRARLRRDLANGIYRSSGPAHNHPPEFEEQRLVAFINECVTEAGKMLDEAPRNIYDRVLRNYPGLAVFYNSAMKKRIERAKRKALQFYQTFDQEAHENSG